MALSTSVTTCKTPNKRVVDHIYSWEEYSHYCAVAILHKKMHKAYQAVEFVIGGEERLLCFSLKNTNAHTAHLIVKLHMHSLTLVMCCVLTIKDQNNLVKNEINDRRCHLVNHKSSFFRKSKATACCWVRDPHLTQCVTGLHKCSWQMAMAVKNSSTSLTKVWWNSLD